MCVCVCVCVCVRAFANPPNRQDVTVGQFQADFNRRFIGVFILFGWLLTEGYPLFISQPYYLSIAEGGNNWIHTFPKRISVM